MAFMKQLKNEPSDGRQLASTVVMVRPDQFDFNSETALTNFFQKTSTNSASSLRNKALDEFKNMVETLRENGLKVIVFPSPTIRSVPDAVFPNNWFSHHESGELIIYPMLSLNRRKERQITTLLKALGRLEVKNIDIIDLSENEELGEILEGTGSLVLDRKNKVAFAMESPRTHRKIFEKWCELFGYRGVFFHAYDKNKMPIYHTNVVMSIGEGFALICMEAVTDTKEKSILRKELQDYNRELIEINLSQVNSFCGNILNVKTIDGKNKIVMSKAAHDAFTQKQREMLGKFGDIIAVDISTIETIGGGSTRCMLAEIFN